MIDYIKSLFRKVNKADESPAMNQTASVKVLFVCMGNICRSPTAEGAFRKRIEEHGLETEIAIDSAGTISYHVGEAPDSRAQAAARERGIELSELRARQISADDFHHFDYIIAMDEDNLRNILALDPGDGKAEVSLFLTFSENFEEHEVPDPYYGGNNGFQRVLDLIEDASSGLLAHIRQHKGL
jgi:protein-tyrosine phosphatase